MKKLFLCLVFLAGSAQARGWFEVQMEMLNEQHDACMEAGKGTSACEQFRHSAEKILPYGQKNVVLHERILAKDVNENNLERTVTTFDKVEALQKETAPILSFVPSLRIAGKTVYNMEK